MRKVKSVWHIVTHQQILTFIMFYFSETIYDMEYEKKEKWAKSCVQYYVFICYAKSSRMRNMVGLEKPGIIKVRSAGSRSGI